MRYGLLTERIMHARSITWQRDILPMPASSFSLLGAKTTDIRASRWKKEGVAVRKEASAFLGSRGVVSRSGFRSSTSCI